jgi:hypothetical protein
LLISSAVLTAALLGLVAAGCGGKSSDTKANEAYADNVCTAIGTWEQEIKSIATNFSGDISKASLQTKLSQAQSATNKLLKQIKAVPPPNTSEGQAAKQQLDQLSSDIDNAVNAAKTSLGQLKANASVATISAAVATLVPQVQSLANQTRSAISTLKNAGGSLSKAFQNTDSCKSLG